VFPFPGFRDATQLPSHLAKRPVHAHRSAQPGTNAIKLFYLVISNPANDLSHLWLYGRKLKTLNENLTIIFKVGGVLGKP
jgi:hypothetical protein